MFKGFGQPKEPSIKQIVHWGKEHYSGLMSLTDDDPEGRQLLSKCVMKFTSGKAEKDIIFGRIVVGHTAHGLFQALMQERGVPSGEALKDALHAILQYILDTPKEELGKVSV